MLKLGYAKAYVQLVQQASEPEVREKSYLVTLIGLQNSFFNRLLMKFSVICWVKILLSR